MLFEDWMSAGGQNSATGAVGREEVTVSRVDLRGRRWRSISRCRSRNDTGAGVAGRETTPEAGVAGSLLAIIAAGDGDCVGRTVGKSQKPKAISLMVRRNELSLEESSRTRAARVSSCATWAKRSLTVRGALARSKAPTWARRSLRRSDRRLGSPRDDFTGNHPDLTSNSFS